MINNTKKVEIERDDAVLGILEPSTLARLLVLRQLVLLVLQLESISNGAKQLSLKVVGHNAFMSSQVLLQNLEVARGFEQS